jgi:amidase
MIEQTFARISDINPKINAIVELREQALDEPALPGPLSGVPITIKDCINVAGMHTTWGNPAFAEYVADEDAVVVQRLRAAGAIIVGKTNPALMLGDFGQTDNPLYGRTNNPWDVDRTPGGSSGGAAAAVAAGLSRLDFGTDLVGSIRIPAAFCGVYGLRPSAGLVPLTGMQPPGPPAGPSEMTYLSTIGPIARSAADLRAALRVIGGPEKPFSWELPPSRHTELREFRVGVVIEDPITPEVADRLQSTVDDLAKAGATIVEGWPDGIDPHAQAETFGFHVQLFFAFAQPGGDFAKLADFVEHENRRMAARRAWADYFRDVDVLLCPPNFTTAFPHDTRPFEDRMIGDRSYQEQAYWTAHAALPGLPAVVAPLGRTAAGLPVGGQIIGPRFEEDTAITFAELIGNYESPPI